MQERVLRERVVKFKAALGKSAPVATELAPFLLRDTCHSAPPMDADERSRGERERESEGGEEPTRDTGKTSTDRKVVLYKRQQTGTQLHLPRREWLAAQTCPVMEKGRSVYWNTDVMASNTFDFVQRNKSILTSEGNRQ